MTGACALAGAAIVDARRATMLASTRGSTKTPLRDEASKPKLRIGKSFLGPFDAGAWHRVTRLLTELREAVLNGCSRGSRVTKKVDDAVALAQGSRAMTSNGRRDARTLARPLAYRRAAAVSAFAFAFALALAAGFGGLACSAPAQRRPIEMQPIGTVKNEKRTVDEPGDSPVTTPNSATPSAAKEAACNASDVEDLAEALRQCETAMPKAADLPTNLREKLEIRVNAGTLSITPGGRVDLTITLRNKSNEPLPLWFALDPMARFDTETLDAKGKRVDLPAGKPPKSPSPPSPKAARITLSAGGTARMKLAWDAVKTKFAPERAASWDRKGPPRAPAGNLPNGKYTLRVLIPLIGAFEKGELDPPKFPIEVGS